MHGLGALIDTYQNCGCIMYVQCTNFAVHEPVPALLDVSERELAGNP